MTRRARSFYTRALSAADRAAVEDALEVEGLDEEIAVLRVQIRRLLEEDKPDAAVLQNGMRLLVQALVAQQRLSGRQAEGLSEAAARLVEEFGAVLGVGSVATEAPRE